MSNTTSPFEANKPIQYLRWIDQGDFFRRPISWLFNVIGLAVAIGTFGLIAQAYDIVDDVGYLFRDDRSGDGVRLIIIFVALLCILLAAGIFCTYIWWTRAEHISRKLLAGDEHIATPLIAGLVQTIAETLGAWVIIVGGLGTLVILIFTTGSDINPDKPILYQYRELRNMGGFGVVLFPVIGWLIVLVGKWLSELLKVASSIANNTQSLRPKPTEEAIVIELDGDVIVIDEE